MRLVVKKMDLEQLGTEKLEFLSLSVTGDYFKHSSISFISGRTANSKFTVA